MSRLSLVRADTARAVEDALITGATNGKIQTKLTEKQLISMLEQYGGAGSDGPQGGIGKKGLTIQRRKYNGLDEDDDDNDDDLM